MVEKELRRELGKVVMVVEEEGWGEKGGYVEEKEQKGDIS